MNIYEIDSEKKRGVIHLFDDKLRNQPNSAFTQLWLQNITHTSDDWSGETQPYNMPLCRLVVRQPEGLWNNAWMKKKIASDLPIESIMEREALQESGQVISFNERSSYEEIAGYGG